MTSEFPLSFRFIYFFYIYFFIYNLENRCNKEPSKLKKKKNTIKDVPSLLLIFLQIFAFFFFCFYESMNNQYQSHTWVNYIPAESFFVNLTFITQNQT